MGRQSTQTQRSSRRSEKLTKKPMKEKFSNEPRNNIKLVGKTKTQIEYLKALLKHPLVIAKGSAGTGKTFLAVGHACKLFQEGKIDQIVITRPNIPTGRSIGFFPGTLEEKMYPWVAQVLAYAAEFLGNSNIVDLMIKKEEILIVPIETMRGRSFGNACVIADEAQNLDTSLLKCITTRIEETGQLILCGDSTQSDLGEHSYNEFDIFCKILEQYDLEQVDIVTFTPDDCIRSGLCKELLQIFEKEKL